MKKKNFLVCTCASLLGLLATSCSDDDYTSMHPSFTDMEFKMLEGATSPLRAGDKIVATAVQSKKGHLLNRTKYSWTATAAVPADSANISQSFRKEVIYDKETFNPTDTLVIDKPGTYTLTFRGQYYTSGDYINFGKKTEPNTDPLVKITYESPTFQYYVVTVKKRFVVK